MTSEPFPSDLDARADWARRVNQVALERVNAGLPAPPSRAFVEAARRAEALVLPVAAE
ncbi:MAG: hypothetical protein HQL38_03090 [Alphaproteobacteria bacterium]|nr:hypothetical protein [Alphaproteobacteria bacterium]